MAAMSLPLGQLDAIILIDAPARELEDVKYFVEVLEVAVVGQREFPMC